MIITESDRDSKSTQSPTTDSTSVAASSSLPAPPTYQSSQAFTAPLPPALPPQMPPTHPLVELKFRQPTWRRFLKAFCIAALIYLLLAMLVKSFVDVAERHLVEGVPAGPGKEDGHIIGCTNGTWANYMDQQPLQELPLSTVPPLSNLPPYSSRTSFSLPVSTSLLYLLSRGSFGHGSIKFELADWSHPRDSIGVDVVLSYHTKAALSRARICHLEREEGGQGIGFFTPSRLLPDTSNPTYQVKFDITVRFPRSGYAGHPLVINAFETDMNIWSHHIASLEGLVVFKSLSLKGSNSLIRVEAVSADFGKFQTSNSPITGSYNVSDSLTLITSNAAITASFRLENRDGQKPTRLEMKTSNGHIQTPITLVSTDKSVSASPAAFSVSAKTSNQPLTVSFPEAPSSPFSLLTLKGKTSNSPAKVSLHPTYEGSISLKTSIYTPVVTKGPSSDPSGRGRNRQLWITRIVRGSLKGDVWWGDDSNKEKGKGTVEVATSNGENKVEL